AAAACSLAALAGTVMVAAALWGGWRIRRTAPTLTFAAWAAAAAYLPTSNLLFPSGIVLAERALYVPVLPVAAAAGCAVDWARSRWRPQRVGLVAGAVLCVFAGMTLARLPVWRDNRTFLLTLLAEFALALRRGERARAVALADTARAHVPSDGAWYDAQLAEWSKR